MRRDQHRDASLLRRDPSKPRAIELLDKVGSTATSALDAVKSAVLPGGLPLVGHVAAGQPLLAEENIEEYVHIPEIAGGEEGEYLLRVRGDSMIKAGIMPDDVVVVAGSCPDSRFAALAGVLGSRAGVAS